MNFGKLERAQEIINQSQILIKLKKRIIETDEFDLMLKKEKLNNSTCVLISSFTRQNDVIEDLIHNKIKFFAKITLINKIQNEIMKLEIDFEEL